MTIKQKPYVEIHRLGELVAFSYEGCAETAYLDRNLARSFADALNRFADDIDECKFQDSPLSTEYITRWDRLESAMVDEVAELFKGLIETIEDEYRVDGQDDDIPTMQVTIASALGDSFAWQTGDNSFHGACYAYPNWGVAYLTRDSDPVEVARECVSELFEAIAQAQD